MSFMSSIGCPCVFLFLICRTVKWVLILACGNSKMELSQHSLLLGSWVLWHREPSEMHILATGTRPLQSNSPNISNLQITQAAKEFQTPSQSLSELWLLLSTPFCKDGCGCYLPKLYRPKGSFKIAGGSTHWSDQIQLMLIEQNLLRKLLCCFQTGVWSVPVLRYTWRFVHLVMIGAL